MTINEIEKHLLKLEIGPALTRGLVRAYCISHDIKYVAKFDKEKIRNLLDQGFIVCWCDNIGYCGIKPHLYSKDEENKYFVHLYLNMRNRFLHQQESYLNK